MKKGNPTLQIFFLIQLVAFGHGCAIQATTEYEPPLVEQGKLYLYLQPLPQEMIPLSFTISDIALIPKQGKTIPLIEEEVRITGSELIDVQKRLLSKTLQPGRYSGIFLTISEVAKTGEGKSMDLIPPAEPMRIELNFTVLRGETLALFLVLSPEFLVTDGSKFTPSFVLAKPQQFPRNYLGFVSNSQENVVSVFNKRTMEIVQVVRTGIGPKGMALDQDKGIVYVALAGDDAIDMINVETMQIYGRVKLRFGDEPVEVALTPDGASLVTANYGSGTVSIIDTRSMQEVNRLSLEPDPVWVVTDREGHRAYVLHSLTNVVSVIDLTNRRLLTSIALDESPWRGALNRDGDKLYIVSQFSTELQVIDTSSLSLSATIFTGGGSSSIKVDPKNDLVYVCKKMGEIVVVDSSSLMFIDSFPVQRDAVFMAIDGEENSLLVLSTDRNTVDKLNLVSKRLLTTVTMEKGAHALVVMGEL